LTAGAAESGPAWPGTAPGYGATPEAAKKHALSEAARLVTEYVQQLDPPLLDWQVSDEFVEKNLLAGEGSQGPDVNIGEHNKVKSWILKLKAPNLEQFTRLDRQAIGARLLQERQAVARGRLLAAGSVFGGLAALLALMMAYCHLAERKKAP
jgi:hypothetical protein